MATGARGQFAFTGLDPELLFRLLAVAEGYTPTYTATPTDPKSGPVTIRLKAHDLATRDPALVFRGRVLDEKGEPVPDALVEPHGYGKGDGAQFGGLKDFDPLALTNDKGEFRLGIPEKGITLYVRVSARGFATRAFRKLPAGQANELRLDDGATVTGRVLKDGRPLSGVAVGLVQQDRNTETFVGAYEAATDDKGVFNIRNVPANEGLILYGLMDSLKAHGAIAAQKIRTGASGTKVDVGDSAVGPGHRLSGKLVLADGKPIPPGTRVILGREEAWDTQQAVVADDGSFVFTGLPPEHYGLSANVRGYRVSAKNASRDMVNPFRLLGTIRADVANLRLLYEPGQAEPPSNFDQETFKEYQRRRDAPLKGAPEE